LSNRLKKGINANDDIKKSEPNNPLKLMLAAMPNKIRIGRSESVMDGIGKTLTKLPRFFLCLSKLW